MTKVRNFIFNDDLHKSGNEILSPKWPLDLGHRPETGPDLTTSNFARTGISSHVFVLSSETFQKACTSKVTVKTPRAKRSACVSEPEMDRNHRSLYRSFNTPGTPARHTDRPRARLGRRDGREEGKDSR